MKSSGCFLIVPVPFIFLIGFLFFNLFNNGNIRIPDGIETAPLDEQLNFGKKALQAKQYELAQKHCGAATKSDDIYEKELALICISAVYERQEDFEKAIEAMEQVRDLDIQSGSDTSLTDERLTELRQQL